MRTMGDTDRPSIPGQERRALRALLPYLWPRGQWEMKTRVVIAVLLMSAAKVATVAAYRNDNLVEEPAVAAVRDGVDDDVEQHGHRGGNQQHLERAPAPAREGELHVPRGGQPRRREDQRG